MSDKGLITRIYRKLKKIISQKFNDSIKKLANELNKAFSKEKVQMTKNHMKNAHYPWP
jgi:transposase-like protein